MDLPIELADMKDKIAILRGNHSQQDSDFLKHLAKFNAKNNSHFQMIMPNPKFTKEFKYSGEVYSKRRDMVVVDNNAIGGATIAIEAGFGRNPLASSVLSHPDKLGFSVAAPLTPKTKGKRKSQSSRAMANRGLVGELGGLLPSDSPKTHNYTNFNELQRTQSQKSIKGMPRIIVTKASLARTINSNLNRCNSMESEENAGEYLEDNSALVPNRDIDWQTNSLQSLHSTQEVMRKLCGDTIRLGTEDLLGGEKPVCLSTHRNQQKAIENVFRQQLLVDTIVSNEMKSPSDIRLALHPLISQDHLPIRNHVNIYIYIYKKICIDTRDEVL